MVTLVSIFTSSHFASATATGGDWREISKSIVEQLAKAQPENPFNIGFLYISDLLVDDAAPIMNFFRENLDVENWVGCTGIGIMGNGESFMDMPAVAAMVGYLQPGSFCLFSKPSGEEVSLDDTNGAWLRDNTPMLILTHGDPLSEFDPAEEVQGLEEKFGGFVLGGLSSSRFEHIQLADAVHGNGLCGVAFTDKTSVATTLSMGCRALGEAHTVTRSHAHVIDELDDQPAQDVFEKELRDWTFSKIGKNSDDILVDEAILRNPADIPEAYKALFMGEVCVGFPVSQSDQGDYLIRNIAGITQDKSIMITDEVMNGETVFFLHRNAESVAEDLSDKLVKLRQRVLKEQGCFEPKGGLYISCIGRCGIQEGQDPGIEEISLIREILGEVPVIGFYSAGEIKNAKIYGHTGILVLFL